MNGELGNSKSASPQLGSWHALLFGTVFMLGLLGASGFAVRARVQAEQPLAKEAGKTFPTNNSPTGENSSARIGGRSLSEWNDLLSRLDPAGEEFERNAPHLITLISDAATPAVTRRRAILLLGRGGAGGQAAVPALIRLLDERRQGEDSPRLWALRALALQGRRAAASVPALIEIVKDSRSTLLERRVALETLSLVGAADPKAIAFHVDVLRRPDETFAKLPSRDRDELLADAVEGVGTMGTSASVAIPLVMRLTSHTSEPLRLKSVETLGRLGREAEIALPQLLERLLFDEAVVVRDAAEKSIAALGPAAVPRLLRWLSLDDLEACQRALSTLGQMKGAATPALPRIEPLLTARPAKIRGAAAAAWGRISGKWERAWPVLVELLTEEDRDVRNHASRVLAEFALTPSGPTALLRLRQLEQDRRGHARAAARRIRREIENAHRVESRR